MSDDASNMNQGHASRRARASRIKGARLRSVPAPVEVLRPDPMAWAYALKAAEGDPRRLAAQPDGSVIIFNHPIR